MPQRTRQQAVHEILLGTALGDAFGQRFLEPGADEHRQQQTLPRAPWFYTDDTLLSVALAQHLTQHQQVIPELLGQKFAHTWTHASDRGFGASAARLFRAVLAGARSETLAKAQFEGMGSAGNGSAMRVAVVGAWFETQAQVIQAAQQQSIVTHTHQEAIDASVAVAIAAHYACACHAQQKPPTEVLEVVLEALPEGTLASRLRKAQRLSSIRSVQTLVAILGDSRSLLARDTVPLCLWVFARLHHDATKALWTCIDAAGDTDTTCAIVGALLAAAHGVDIWPDAWCNAVEPLPNKNV